jgi:hypothetical protein
MSCFFLPQAVKRMSEAKINAGANLFEYTLALLYTGCVDAVVINQISKIKYQNDKSKIKYKKQAHWFSIQIVFLFKF